MKNMECDDFDCTHARHISVPDIFPSCCAMNVLSFVSTDSAIKGSKKTGQVIKGFTSAVGSSMFKYVHFSPEWFSV